MYCNQTAFLKEFHSISEYGCQPLDLLALSHPPALSSSSDLELADLNRLLFSENLLQVSFENPNYWVGYYNGC